MKNLILLCLICFGTNLVSAQNRFEAKKENRDVLHRITAQYVAENPNDTTATDLHKMLTAKNTTYQKYLNDRSNGAYSSYSTLEKAEFENQTCGDDLKAADISRSIEKTFRQYNTYFMKVSPPYKIQMSNFRAKLKAGAYGKKSDVKHIRKKRK